MDTNNLKRSIHELVDKIEDEELLHLYFQLLQREIERGDANKDFFNTTQEDLIERGRSSLASVKAGKTRSIDEFKKDIKSWKKNQSTS